MMRRDIWSVRRMLLTPMLVAAAIACAAASAGAAEPAVPDRAPASAPTLDAYGDLPGIEEMKLSPSGKQLAVLSRIKGDRRILVIDREAGNVKFNAPVGDAKLRDLTWAGDDLVLVTQSATVSLGYGFTADRAELAGVMVVPLGGAGKPHYVFDNSNTIAHTTMGRFGIRQIDGRWTGFYGGMGIDVSAGSSVLKPGRALYQVDLVKNSPRPAGRSSGDGHYRDWLIDAAGHVAATLDISASTGRWTVLNASSKVIASGVDPTGDVGLMFFGQDGTTAIYATEDDKAGVTRWMEVPLAGGQAKEILADVPIDRTYVDPTSGRLIGYLERGDKPVVHFFDPARQTAMAKVLRAFPKLHVDLVNWTPDFTKLLVHTSGTDDSGTWYIVDVVSRHADAVGYDRLAIMPGYVGPISTVTYKAGDGLEMSGILTLPPRAVLHGREARKLPVVLLPHGGPTAADEAQFDWWAQAFAAQGYAVFQPNFRGSTDRSDAFRRAGNGQWGRSMQTDISDGLDALAKQGIVDPKRACIVGASYGGYAALAGVTLQKGIYRCAVAVAGVADLNMMYNTDLSESGDSPMTSRALRETLGAPNTFAAVSPRRHAAEADAPILLIHGKDDTVVPFHQSEAMASALRGAGKPVEMVVLKQEDHWLSRAATRKQMLEAAVAFVKKHDPPD